SAWVRCRIRAWPSACASRTSPARSARVTRVTRCSRGCSRTSAGGGGDDNVGYWEAMSDAVRTTHDLSALVAAPKDGRPRVAPMVDALRDSEILRISGEIRALMATGQPVCDLTVGDFSPRHF